jgi:hypothetical protein
MLKEEFWGFTFEDHRAYGMDILKRLHAKINMKQGKFIMTKEIEICETTW